jgi:hypothetical protein
MPPIAAAVSRWATQHWVFEAGGRSTIFSAHTDSAGLYSVTLAPGQYHVQVEYTVKPDAVGHPGGLRRADFSGGPRDLTVVAGQRLEADYSVVVMQQ